MFVRMYVCMQLCMILLLLLLPLPLLLLLCYLLQLAATSTTTTTDSATAADDAAAAAANTAIYLYFFLARQLAAAATKKLQILGVSIPEIEAKTPCQGQRGHSNRWGGAKQDSSREKEVEEEALPAPTTFLRQRTRIETHSDSERHTAADTNTDADKNKQADRRGDGTFPRSYARGDTAVTAVTDEVEVEAESSICEELRVSCDSGGSSDDEVQANGEYASQKDTFPHWRGNTSGQKAAAAESEDSGGGGMESTEGSGGECEEVRGEWRSRCQTGYNGNRKVAEEDSAMARHDIGEQDDIGERRDTDNTGEQQEAVKTP